MNIDDFNTKMLEIVYFMNSIINFAMIYTPLNFFVHLKLRKIESNINIKIDSLPVSVKTHDFNKLNLDNLDVQDDIKFYIKRFICVLSRKAEHIDLNNFFEKFKNLNIEVVDHIKSNSQLNVSQTVGKHSEGKLTLLKGYEGEVIFHELFHNASHKGLNIIEKNENVMESYYLKISGFERSKYKENLNGCLIYLIGKGLNEGYTEILDERYFPKGSLKEYPSILVDVVVLIEYILGQKETEQAYINGDLFFIVHGLSKYTEEDEAKKILRKLDYIYSAFYQFGGGYFTSIGIKNAYKYLLFQLTRIYLKKMQITFLQEEISDKSNTIKELNFLRNLLTKKHYIGLLNLYGLSKKDSKMLCGEIEDTIIQKRLSMISKN